MGRLFVADQDALVAARSELVGPAGQARELARQVAVEVGHEFGELLRILDPEEHVNRSQRWPHFSCLYGRAWHYFRAGVSGSGVAQGQGTAGNCKASGRQGWKRPLCRLYLWMSSEAGRGRRRPVGERQYLPSPR